MAAAILTHSAEEIIGGDIAFLRLYIAERIERKHLHLSCEIAIAFYHLFHPVTLDEIIVYLPSRLHLHGECLA